MKAPPRLNRTGHDKSSDIADPLHQFPADQAAQDQAQRVRGHGDANHGFIKSGLVHPQRDGDII